MNDRFAFWKGVTAGVFGGIAVGALARLSAAEAARFSSQSGTPRGRATGPTSDTSLQFNQAKKVRLRRESAESAGDPRITGPVPELRQVEGSAFERPPGAPGGRTPAEILEAPGRPGQPMDHAIHQRSSVEAEEALPVH
jgi:hypothetical protein